MKNLKYLLMMILFAAFAGEGFAVVTWQPGINSTKGFVNCNGAGGTIQLSSAFFFNNSPYDPGNVGIAYHNQAVWAVGEDANGNLTGLQFGNGNYQMPVSSFEFGNAITVNALAGTRVIYICMNQTIDSYLVPNSTNTTAAIQINGHAGSNFTFKVNVWNHSSNFDVTSVNSISCSGGSVALTSQYTSAGNPNSVVPHWNTPYGNGVSIIWKDGNGTTVGTGKNITVNPTVTTTYTATFKADNHCVTTDQVTVTVISDPMVSLTYNSICNGATTTNVTTEVVGYTNWTWYNSYVEIKNVANTFSQFDYPPYNGLERTFTNLPADDYYIVFTTACGVINSNTFTIQSGTSPTVTSNIVHPKCAGETGTILLTSSGGNSPYTYNWSDANGSLPLTGPNAFGLAGGTYTIEVVSATGCSSTINAVVNSAPANAIGVSYTSISNAQCLGFANGEMTVNVSGGVAPYSVNWLTGQTSYGTVSTYGSASRSNLIGGVTYTITVIDNNGCTKKFYKYVGNNSSNITLPSQQIAVTDETCLGIMDGKVDLSTTTPSCNFSWQTGQNTAIISDLAGSTYTVTATNTTSPYVGCQTIKTYTVGQGTSKWHLSTENQKGDEDRIIKILTDNTTNDVYVLGEFKQETKIGGTSSLKALNLNTGIFVAKYNECGTQTWEVYTDKLSGAFINMNAIDIVPTYNTIGGITGIHVFGKTDGSGAQLFKWHTSFNANTQTPDILNNEEVFSLEISNGGVISNDLTYPLLFTDIINDVEISSNVYFAGQFTGVAGVKEWDGSSMTDAIKDLYTHNEISAMVLDGGDIYAVANLTANADFGLGTVAILGQTEAVLLHWDGSPQLANMAPAEANEFVHTTDIIMDDNGNLWVSGQFNEELSGWQSLGSPIRTGIVLNFDPGLHALKSFIVDPTKVNGLQECSANALSVVNNELYVAGTFMGSDLVIGNPNYGFTNPSLINGSGGTQDLWMAKYDFNNQMFNWIEASNSGEDVEVNDISFDGRNAYIGGAYKQNIDFMNKLVNLNRPYTGSNPLGFAIRGGDIYSGGNDGMYYKTGGNTSINKGEEDNSLNVSELGIYPNPNEGLFTLTYNSESVGNVEIQIFDITGSIVFQVSSNKQVNQLEQKIDLTHLSSGIYMVASQHNGMTKYQKFLIK